MASKSNVVILNVPTELTETWTIPKKTSEVIAVGDPVEDNGSGVEVVDGAENPVFAGISLEARAADDTRDVSVAFKCAVKVKLASGSTAVTRGDPLAYSTGANGTDWTFTQTAAEGIIWALEDGSAGDTIRALVDVPNLAVTAGLFTPVTT